MATEAPPLNPEQLQYLLDAAAPNCESFYAEA
jgi:hypothetical protein